MPQMQHHVDLLVTGAAEVLTCAAGAPDLIGGTSGGVAIDAGVVVAVGDVSEFTASRTVDAGGCVVMPGFVDAHTHVVFGGSRAQEYAARAAGLEPPAGAVVGIAGTTTVTRAQSPDQLLAPTLARVRDMLAHGTTTLESKSGYGLDRDTELRILDTNAAVGRELPVDVVSTYLGAHAFPPGGYHAAYLETVLALTGQVGDQGLARFCDVYCDEGYFTLEQSATVLRAGLDAGLAPKIHLDAYSHTGAAALACEVGAVSADHLNFTTHAELGQLAAAGVVGVYMPCLEYSVAHPRPLDPRRLLAAGMELALATDMCPGCWATSMQLAVQMAVRTGGLTVAAALRAATLGGAASLDRADRVGSLEPGKQADLLVLDLPSHLDVAYRLGHNSIRTVIRHGDVVIDKDAA